MSAFIPRWWWRTCREGVLAFVTAVTVANEVRDMYEKHQWETVAPGTSAMMRTGDVVVIANRWFTLETFGHKFYSWTTKAVMKTAWDDVGLIIEDPGDSTNPHILIVEYDHVVFMPFKEFCDKRQPRGVAVRTLIGPDPAEPPAIPNRSVDDFVTEARSRVPTPYSVVRAAWQTKAERAHYRWAMESSELAFEIRQRMADGGASEQAIARMRDQLIERFSVGEHYAKALGTDHPRPNKSLHNASLVAEGLQHMGLMTKPFPLAFRYTPVDFAWRLPMINVNLSSPKMVFTS